MSENSPLQRTINQPPVLFQETQDLIGKLENLLGSTFLVYWTSPTGSICHSDVEALHEILQNIGEQQEVYLFIKSDGGSGLTSLRIVHLLRHYASRLKVVLPLDCASAATMIVLGAEEIHMGPLAYLTAIDTSITHPLSPIDTFNHRVAVSQDELTRVIDLWRAEANPNSPHPYQTLFEYVHPLVVGAVDRASSLSIKVCTQILSYHMSDRQLAEKISKHLNSDYPSHSYPITFKEAQTIGLNVLPLASDINALLLELHQLYSEMGQKAFTYFDESHYHNYEIMNILEGRNVQIYYKSDEDWYYRSEERRWVRMNDESSWRKTERIDEQIRESVFHIR
jgi:Serine dehydrogenase proteinase